MRRADFDSHGVPSSACVKRGGKMNPRGFGEDHVGSAVKDAGYLRVPFHWHGCHSPFGTELGEPNTHFHHKGANPMPGKPIMELFGHTCTVELVDKPVRREIVHHAN